MSSEIAQLKEDRDQYQEQLDLVLGSLSDDPDNAELLALKEELQAALDIIDESLDALKQAAKDAPAAAASSYQQKSKPPADDHPQSDATPRAYKVNESILARWVTGDKAFYPARIMSITGSATAPMYTVKFKSYDTIETLRARDIKPVASSSGSASAGSTKRKADVSAVSSSIAAPSEPAPPATTGQQQTSPPPPPPPSSGPAPPAPPAPSSYAPPAAAQQQQQQPPPPPPPPAAAAPPPRPFGTRTIDRFSAGVVSSAAAQIYPQAMQQQQPSRPGGGGFGKFGASTSAAAATVLGEEPPPAKKFKKIKATKQLEAGKSKWQEFNSKGKTSKIGKKDSMFRTPEGAQGRVGFIGSGQAMRKDATRSRHIYQTNEDLD